jgi:hypothetical protein
MSVALTDVANALVTILSALPDVDVTSVTTYSPPITTKKVALLIVPFGQTGTMQYGMIGRYSYIHAHRIPCQFWVKSDLSQRDDGITRARDIVPAAMRLVAVDPTLLGTVLQLGSTLLGNQGQIGQYEIRPLFEENSQIPYVVATLFVPVEIREETSFG